MREHEGLRSLLGENPLESSIPNWSLGFLEGEEIPNRGGCPSLRPAPATLCGSGYSQCVWIKMKRVLSLNTQGDRRVYISSPHLGSSNSVRGHQGVEALSPHFATDHCAALTPWGLEYWQWCYWWWQRCLAEVAAFKSSSGHACKLQQTGRCHANFQLMQWSEGVPRNLQRHRQSQQCPVDVSGPAMKGQE